MGYSLTKRFTFLCHLILGIGLSLAPVGTFVAVTGYFHFLPIILGFAVLFWVSGFDIIYALQDESFDQSKGLVFNSTLAFRKYIKHIKNFHIVSAALMVIFYMKATNYWIPSFFYDDWNSDFYRLAFSQHKLVRPNDHKG